MWTRLPYPPRALGRCMPRARRSTMRRMECAHRGREEGANMAHYEKPDAMTARVIKPLIIALTDASSPSSIAEQAATAWHGPSCMGNAANCGSGIARGRRINWGHSAWSSMRSCYGIPSTCSEHPLFTSPNVRCQSRGSGRLDLPYPGRLLLCAYRCHTFLLSNGSEPG